MLVVRPNQERLRYWRNVMGELGGLAVIWLGDATGLQSYAIPATLALIGLDALRRWHAHTGFTTLWFALNGMALGYGALSLTAAVYLSPERFGALCAFLLAFFFLIGSLTRVSLIQALAEQRQAARFSNPVPFLDSFFRLYTRVWAGFFLLRGFYLLYLGAHSHSAFMAGIALKTSLVAMILLSFKGEALYRLYAALRGRSATGKEAG